ncbi:MAG: hypothetical protein ACXWNG_07235, partial [Candidatus Limnocylindrales bacterium]
ETRVRPSDDAPITAPTGNRSPVRLLRSQVRNLALERMAGGGTRGTDLDALSAAAGGGPVSALVAGWAASAATPAARLAAPLLRGGPADPAAAIYPTFALVGFVADATGAGGSTSNRPPGAALAMFQASRTPDDRASAILAASSSDYCAAVSTYLSAALNGIVDSTADPPTWMKVLIDLYAPQYASDPGRLRRTIGAIALLAYATSLARAWTVSLVPDPPSVAYGIEGGDPVEGEVQLGVVSGTDVFSGDVADCAALANAQFTSVPVKGSSVIWDASGLGVHAKEATAEPMLDENGAAGLDYTMSTETKDTAQNGDPVTTQMWVNALVDRAEMAALAAVVKSILLGDAAGTPAGPTAKALYAAMEPKLDVVMRPSGFALIDVTLHTPKASPSPTASSTSDLTGTWIGTWNIGPPYAGTGGFTMELVQTGGSFRGTVELSNTDCSNGTVSGTIAGTSLTFGWLLTPQPVQLSGAVKGTSMSGTWASISCNGQNIPLSGTWEATKQQ